MDQPTQPLDVVQRIKDVMLDQAMTLRNLSERAVIPYATLNRRLAGDGTDLTLQEVARISCAMGVDAGWLLTGHVQVA